VELVQSAIHHVSPCVTVRTTRLAILSDCATNLQLPLNFASQDHAVEMPSAMWLEIARSATAARDMWEMLTRDAVNRVAPFATPILVDPMPTALWLATDKRHAFVLTVCQEIPRP